MRTKIANSAFVLYSAIAMAATASPAAGLFAAETGAPEEQRSSQPAAMDAETLAKNVHTVGHTVIYGFHFEADEVSVQKETLRPALEAIAQLLKSNSVLKLLVVVHTDNVGTLGHSLDISRRRAVSVVNALVADFGIDRARLTPAGVGFLAPIASNRSAEGRALNRRVELVEWLEP